MKVILSELIMRFVDLGQIIASNVIFIISILPVNIDKRGVSVCELLGVSSLHPVTLEMSLQKLMQRAELSNPDGRGAVFYERNDVYLFRETEPANNSTLANFLAKSGIASHLVLSHIRRATTGSIELRHTMGSLS